MDESVEKRDSLEDLFPFYILGGLSQEESAQVDAYLAANPEARERLVELGQAASMLPYSAAPVDPPARTKQILMGRVTIDSGRPRRQPAHKRFRPRLPALFRRSPGRSLAAPVLAWVAVVVVILAGLWGLVVYNEIDWLHDQNLALSQELEAQRDLLFTLQTNVIPLKEDNASLQNALETQAESLAFLRNEVTTLREANADLAREAATQAETLAAVTGGTEPSGTGAPLESVQEDLVAQGDTLAALSRELADLQAQNAALRQELEAQRAMMAQVTSPGVQTMPLGGAETAPGAQGQLIANPNGQSAVLLVSGLPPLEAGQVYQFWLVQDGAEERAGVFSVDAQGVGTLHITTDAAIGSYEAMGVSVEPAGGSEEPTGDMIMLGSFS